MSNLLYGIVGLQLEQANELKRFKQELEHNQNDQQLQEKLKNSVFQFKEEAKKIINFKNIEEKAFYLRHLEYQLSNSGLQPDLFSDFKDKEYVQDLIHFVSSECFEVCSKFTENKIQEIDSAIDSALNIQHCEYYLENFNQMNEFIRIKKIEEQNDGLGCLGRTFIGLLGGFIILLSFIFFLFELSIIGVLSIVIAMLLFVWIFISSEKEKEVDIESAKLIEINSSVDINYLLQLDEIFKGQEFAEKELKESKMILKKFISKYGIT